MGIDYGNGQTNIDKATGIRYGVLPANDILQAWADDAEAEYGLPCCPMCGNEVEPYTEPTDVDEEEAHAEYKQYNGENGNYSCCEYICDHCKLFIDTADTTPDEPMGYYYSADGYNAHQYADNVDIFVTKSPYCTFAPFCSPCAPGACYLRDGAADGDAKAYCFGHDWFEDGVAPYPVYSVATDELILPDKK